MRIAHTPQELRISRSAVTIGNFDGVHRGHQSLIARTRERAEQDSATGIVVTFWPHPRSVVTPQKPHCPIATREKRLEYLEDMGIDCVLELAFTKELAARTPEEFVRDCLLPLNVRHIVTGYDFSLGKGRMGHTTELRTLGETMGFTVEQMPPLMLAGDIVSSTRLRRLLQDGAIQEARSLLGRPYELTGHVIHGCGRGKSIGFPTANLSRPETILPKEGVYACSARVRGMLCPSVVNIGRNPTFDAKELSIECFLLDTDMDLYDETLELLFLARLRDEQKFPDAAALAGQIAEDVTNARRLFQEGIASAGEM